MNRKQQYHYMYYELIGDLLTDKREKEYAYRKAQEFVPSNIPEFMTVMKRLKEKISKINEDTQYYSL